MGVKEWWMRLMYVIWFFLVTGTVTTNQYRSALHSIGLPVDDEEIRVLAKRFAATKGMDR